MKVQNIHFTAAPSRKNMNKRQQEYHTPAGQGIKTAGAWFGFGVGLDYIGRKCAVFKSPAKNSLFINTILASGAGAYTYFKSLHTEH